MNSADFEQTRQKLEALHPLYLEKSALMEAAINTYTVQQDAQSLKVVQSAMLAVKEILAQMP